MLVAVLSECSLPPCLFRYSVGIYISFPVFLLVNVAVFLLQCMLPSSCFSVCCRLLASVYVAVILLQCMLPASSSILSVSLGTVLSGLGFDCTACVAVFPSLSVSLGTVLVGLSLTVGYCCVAVFLSVSHGTVLVGLSLTVGYCCAAVFLSVSHGTVLVGLSLTVGYCCVAVFACCQFHLAQYLLVFL